jgi:putative glutamine amidotransferase
VRWQLRRYRVEVRRLTPATGYPGHDLAGFVIGGGNDIDPAVYGGDVSETPSVDPLRDQFELSVLDLADRAGVPVLGICRGAQLINVHAGGTLFSDLRPHRVLTSNRGTLLPRKVVQVEGDSKLARALGRERTRVNSLHHQAVDRTGRGLAIVARDRDNIVQGIENMAGPLRIGVQWHPEYLPQRTDQRSLFGYFVAHCRGPRPRSEGEHAAR